MKKFFSSIENRALTFGLGAIIWITVIMNVPYWYVMYQKSVTGVEKSFSPWVGLFLVIVGLAMALAGLFFGITGYRKGERSGKLMLGLIASGAVLAMALMFLVGEFIFPH